MPTIPVSLTAGPEWQIGGVGGLSIDGGPASTGTGTDGRPAEVSGASFGDFLAKQVSSLDAAQDEAAKESMAVANGTSQDPTAAVMAIEKAQLAMQLASQIRTKSVEAINDVFHTTV